VRLDAGLLPDVEAAIGSIYEVIIRWVRLVLEDETISVCKSHL